MDDPSSTGRESSPPKPLLPSQDAWLSGAPLAARVTTFVGRELEVAAVTSLLRDQAARLVTLTGPGGVGKTRLALAAAQAVVSDYTDGVRFVPLASITDPELVLPTIARAVGVQDAGSRSIVTSLMTVLDDQHLLLVLDNFEQVVDAAPVLLELIAACPTISVLVTSRALLRVSGEHVVPIEPLDVGSPEATPDELISLDAVQLFADRAREVESTFTLSGDSAAVVAAICNRLDGLPLAIELAAAKTRLLPLDALLAGLDRRLPLLTGGARDQPSRLRTMRDAIAWSYELLGPEDQFRFRRLAVFTGGFTFEAAAAVIDDEVTEAVLGIERLTNQSLVRRLSGPDEAPRFTMLETIRDFGLEQLVARGEETEVREQHATLMLNLATRADAEIQGPDGSVWLDRLDRELPNLRIARDYFAFEGDAASELQLVLALQHFWYVRGHLREGIAAVEAAIVRSGESVVELRGQAHSLLALLTWAAGETERALDLTAIALDLARDADDAYGQAMATYYRFLATAWGLQAWEQAIPIGTDAVAQAQQLEQAPWFLPFALGDTGEAMVMAGQSERGIKLLEEALELHHVMGHRFGAGMKLLLLAVIAQRSGNSADAVQRYLEGLQALTEGGDQMSVNLAMTGLAGIAADQRRWAEAARLLGIAAAVRERTGARLQVPWQPILAQTERLTRKALGDEEYDTWFNVGRTLSLSEAVDEALTTASGLTQRSAGQQGPSPYSLSPRELEVLTLLTRRWTDKEIAEELFISPRTVQAHISSILRKLDVNSRREAAAVAVRLGLT